MNETASRQLSIIHLALGVGQVAFFGIAFLLTYTGSFTTANDPTLANLLQIISPLMAIACIAMSYFLFNKQVKEGANLEGAEHEIAYKAASIVRWALIEGASFFAIVCYLLTANTTFALIFLICFIAFLISKPSKQGFKNSL